MRNIKNLDVPFGTGGRMKQVIELLENALEEIYRIKAPGLNNQGYFDRATGSVKKALEYLKASRRGTPKGEFTGALDDDKFIVINRKRFKKLNNAAGHANPRGYFSSHLSVLKLEAALYNFAKNYEEATGKKLDQKYIVCNQDESYANEVAALILDVKPRRETPEQRETE
jgi:hypothetical protein